MLLRVDNRNDIFEVESIKHLPDSEQAEAIADSFARISNEYNPMSIIQLTDQRYSCLNFVKLTF